MVAGENVVEFNDWHYGRLLGETNIANWPLDKVGHRRMGVALIGLGRMGLVHLRNLLREPRANLMYCIDSDHTRLAAYSKSQIFRDFGIQALHCDQFALALRDPDVSAVIIATPTHTHEELTRRALQAGKSVMCEKPLTSQTSGIMPLYQLAQNQGVFLLAAFNRRYDPDFRHLHRQLKSKRQQLGALQMVRITSRDAQPPPLSYVRLSGGLFHDTCIHDIDMCLWFMRQLPVALQVLGKTWREFYASDPAELAKLSAEDRELLPQIDDYFLAVITLKFEDGSIGVLDNSRQASYGYDQRCEIYCSNGMLKCDGRRPVDAVEFNAAGCVQSTLNCSFASRYSSAYENELKDLLTMAELVEREQQQHAITVDARPEQNGNGQQQQQRNGHSEPATIKSRARDASRTTSHEHLLEPVRPTAVVAAHTIADACLEASKSGQMIDLNWPDAFKRQFKIEIET